MQLTVGQMYGYGGIALRFDVAVDAAILIAQYDDIARLKPKRVQCFSVGRYRCGDQPAPHSLQHG